MSALDASNQEQLVLNISGYAHEASQALIAAGYAHSAPSVIYKPKLMRDGNAWIALLGDNLQDGVVGTGSTPAEAMRAFDRAWYETTGGAP